MLALLLATLALTPPTSASGGAEIPLDSLSVISGTVRAEGYRSHGRLVGAVVEVRQDGRIARSVADADGRYRLADLAPGAATVVVYHIAALPFELDVLIPSGSELPLDVTVEPRILALQEIRTRGVPGLNDPVEPVDAVGRTRSALGLRALGLSPGMAEAGLATAFPGENGAGGGRALYMRGSAVDARVVLLDGAPVLTPFHVAGLVEPFDPELLGRADVYLGGAPSSYGGGLSYLMDVRTRAPRRDRLRGSVDLDGIAARARAEVPLPAGASLLVGARGLHGLLPTLGNSDRFPYRFDDLLVRGGVPLSERHALRATGFRNREGVRLDAPDLQGEVSEPARWGNEVVTVGYEGRLGETHVEATAASSRYTSALPVLFWPEPVIARGSSARTRLHGSIIRSTGGGALRVGGTLESIRYAYRLDPVDPETAGVVAGEPSLDTSTQGLFGEWTGPIRGGLTVRAGVRADRFGHVGEWRFGPRMSVRVPLGERAALAVSTGRYHQTMPAPGLRGATEVAGASVLRWSPSLPVASATHLIVGLEQSVEELIHLEVSGFFKAFSGMENALGGLGRSSGAELRVAHDGDRVRGWLGYQISWFWTLEDGGMPDRFDGRHLLAIGAEGSLPGGFELGGSMGVGAGLPMSAVQHHVEPEMVSGIPTVSSSGIDRPRFRMLAGQSESPLELAPADDFLRLDLELSRPLEPTVGNRHTQLRPYFRVLNALDQRDALFYYFDGWRGDEVRPLAQRPFLPVVGVEWRF